MSILTMHHGLMAGIKQGDPPGYVTIGGRLYRTVTIGTQTWLAENLDYKVSGITLGGAISKTEPRANYYNNDESTYGRGGSRECGLLYNYTAQKMINDNRDSLLPPGWHIPSNSELGTLLAFIGGSTANKLKKGPGLVWGYTWNGTDDYGFSVLPGGDRSSNGPFEKIGERTNLAVCEIASTGEPYYWPFRYNGSTVSYPAITINGSQQYIRLVKDA